MFAVIIGTQQDRMLGGVPLGLAVQVKAKVNVFDSSIIIHGCDYDTRVCVSGIGGAYTET